MIVKLDGIDGCGKSTLCNAVAKELSKRYTVATVSEFASPAEYVGDSVQPTPIHSLRIREAALDPSFDCDDVERQLLLHFLSRRKNRVELPTLSEHNDFVIVDRSTLSNYAYATAVDPRFARLFDLVCKDVERADVIFWIDTPVTECVKRLRERTLDSVEKKGQHYFERVRRAFKKQAAGHSAIQRLDGRQSIEKLVEEVTARVGGKPGEEG